MQFQKGNREDAEGRELKKKKDQMGNLSVKGEPVLPKTKT